MNKRERAALQSTHTAILRDLDANEVAPYLFERGLLRKWQYTHIHKSKKNRKTVCQDLLHFITKRDSKCTFKGFMDALRHDNVYSFLADKAEARLSELENDTKHAEVETCQPDMMYEPVRKINVYTENRKRMADLAHHLKRLSHDGEIESLKTITDEINQKFMNNKLNLALGTTERMELADMRFTSLEAEASSRRVKYDTSLYGSDVFTEMVSVIPFTSNPSVNNMTYLARFGSAVSMKESLDNGLAYLDYAKQHAENVLPCTATGMVFYIEVNMLTQKYEHTPTDDLKAKILQTTELAIAQFNEEGDDIKKDYQRMLMLKMVFCYLGIGLFGKRIETVQSTITDREKAKNCLDFIEKPDIWCGMEKRRKMLFLLAKSEYYRQQNASTAELSLIHAKEAERIARENKWAAELPNIENLIKELEICNINDNNGTKHNNLSDIIYDEGSVCNLAKDISNFEEKDKIHIGHEEATNGCGDTLYCPFTRELQPNSQLETGTFQNIAESTNDSVSEIESQNVNTRMCILKDFPNPFLTEDMSYAQEVNMNSDDDDYLDLT